MTDSVGYLRFSEIACQRVRRWRAAGKRLGQSLSECDSELLGRDVKQ